MKGPWIILGIGALAIVGLAYYFGYDHGYEEVPSEITSFEECAAAGYPIGELYPRQCWTPDGKHFVEKVGAVGEFWGVIYGTVLLGPTCPVVQNPPDPECADKPYQTALALMTADQSRVIQEFTSAADGTFTVEVPPGDYAIRSAAAANILPYCASNEIITVPTNGYAEVVVSCDTGIR